MERIKKNTYNRFHGSLEPLKSLSKLKDLDISCTDIDFGLEFLPDSIEEFHCGNEGEFKKQAQEIYNELFLYGGNLKSWKEAYPELMIKC
jgi:hypothetical protein